MSLDTTKPIASVTYNGNSMTLKPPGMFAYPWPNAYNTQGSWSTFEIEFQASSFLALPQSVENYVFAFITTGDGQECAFFIDGASILNVAEDGHSTTALLLRQSDSNSYADYLTVCSMRTETAEPTVLYFDATGASIEMDDLTIAQCCFQSIILYKLKTEL